MAKQQFSITELKVGIFVVVVCFIAAVAIFTIGSQVGMFEEQFVAVTYLPNVSGLKPGDLVLLGGVEVGNVTAVRLTSPEDIPPTEENIATLRRISELTDELNRVESQLQQTQTEVQQLLGRLQEKERTLGPSHPEVSALRRQHQDAERKVRGLEERREQLREDVERERTRLQNVAVEMSIKSDYRDWIRADSRISLGSIGLLGDKAVEISLGRSDEPAKTIYRERDTWLGKEKYEVVLVTGSQQSSFAELITGANDILSNIETLSAQAESILRSLGSGEGTVGRFLTDESFYENLNQTVSSANETIRQAGQFIRNLNEGPGTIGRLVQDDTLHKQLVSTTDNLEELLRKINEGEGTAGRLVNDAQLYDNLNATMADLKEITGQLRSGEGTIGKLITEEELYRSLTQSADNLAGILDEIQKGRGTLGRLSKDEALYENLNKVSAELVKLLYDFRQDPKKFLTIRVTLF
ncbi:MAG TPA: hypothetical protein P5568_05820 [Acidobacteriota bacterium]|nr:hypothetical protein [Acidobacteriota bacterium]HRR56113.1 hypothetical protein [Acidobacteriota bacterium]HRV07970.1 hypothetical protein [Acidobacteriota bacterium]